MVTIEEVSEAGDHHIHRWKHDVFLSFRGEDIKKTFVDHLYSALVRSGIYTFKDDERLETGESISPALLKAIEESSFAVIIFSKNYASSRWCLDELVKIMECSRKLPNGQTVIPIFYHVEPSDVRKQEGHFGELFRKHNLDKVQIWRKTLTDAANLSGLELNSTVDGHESKFIDRIVQEIWSKLPSKIDVEDEGLVGMKSRIEEVTLLLGEEANVVRTVGMWGLSGIGKSTLARAVYRQIKDQFEVAYFLDEVGEASKKGGLKSLQQHFLSKSLGVKDLQIASDMDGIALMKTRLRSRRVLLVLDDVDSSEQLEALAGSHEWFGPGSRIIITTGDRKLLVMHNVDQIHEASVLDYVEATKLFRWKTFNDMCPTKEFEELSVQVINYCEGLPLALEVMSSALRCEDLDIWKDSLRKLREVPNGDILKKLKISFDGLHETVQNTFLDIACFFVGREEERVTRILDSFDFYPNLSITILVHKSLIHCSDGLLCMHQLIREMGRHIVCQNFSREPGKYSRLWDTSDVEHVLTRNMGTVNIEGILLDPQQILRDPHEREYTIEMGTNAFRKMSKLRLLEIHNVYIPKGPDYLPNELRWIDWDKYPSNCLPTTFEADILVGLRLHCSRLKQLWEGRTKKKLKNLKYVDLSDSRNLVGISHLGEAYNLKELILQGCTSLVKVDPCIGYLKKLVCLDLAGCEKLRSLPEAIHWEYLEVLNLFGCVKLQKFPEVRENMDKLLQLYLEETAIEELPSSIGYIRNLVLMDLRRCKNLVILPSTLGTLKHLKSLVLSDCSKVEKLPEEMGNLECLEELLLDGTAVSEIPPSIGCLKNLKVLSLRKRSSQSPTSVFQSLFQLSKRQKSTRSLVLPPIWGLTSLTQLDLTDCNMLVIPGDLGSLFSLNELRLGGNNFENLPSLNQLSQLAHLELNRCEMLRELPELPSRINELFANDCVSLRVSADRFAMCKIEYGWFQNCRKLLDYGESEIVASTLLQRKLQGTLRSFLLHEQIILPGRAIPEWFYNHTFTGHSVLLKLPQNWYYNPKVKGYSFFVILEVINKVKSCSFFDRDDETDCREVLHWSGLRHDGPITGVGVELSFTEPGHYQSIQSEKIYLRETGNITGLEHTIMGYQTLYLQRLIDCGWNEHVGIEVGIRSLSPDTVVVKKWGVRLVFKEEEDDDDDDNNTLKTSLMNLRQRRLLKCKMMSDDEVAGDHHRWKYNVFLSFQGEDTRKAFVDHLYSALVRSGICTFKDDERLGMGEPISPPLLKAIEESSFAVIVFSKNYASSRWCLDVLVKVMECNSKSPKGKTVIPIFYDVEPLDVRKQEGHFGEMFRKHDSDRVQIWRKTLTDAANLSGLELNKTADGDKTKFIHKITEAVQEKMKAVVKHCLPIQAETKDRYSSGSKEISQFDQKDATDIRLMNIGLSKLPENSKFPAQEKLFLQLDHPDLRKIPFSFFVSTTLLLVLDLSNTSIKFLPSSISSLVKLQKMLLRDCELLMELPPEIGALWNLNMLDLEGTELICLPKEIGALCNLRCLKVSMYRCSDNYKERKGIETIIPRETLSKFSLLKELSIDVDPECVWWDAEVETIMKDLIHLKKLETLKLYLPSIELLQLFLQLQWYGKRKGHGEQAFSRIYPCLSHFRLIVGRCKQSLMSRLPRDLLGKFEKLDRSLKYMNGEGSIDKIAKALKHANALFLDRHLTIENLSVFKNDEMEYLCFCLLVQCNEMKNIVDGNELYQGDKSDVKRPILGSLQYLSMHYMKNLESIWKGPIVSGCLSCLKFLSIHTCPKLSTIFNVGLLGNLINLKELIVEDCREIKSLVIVESSSLESDLDFLPSLEKISLLHLPELVNISSGLCIGPRLERMVVYNCPKLKSLSPVELSSKYLVEIKGEDAWWEQLEWHTSRWGSGQPDYLVRVFVPFGRGGDLMEQLAEAVKTSLVFEENLRSKMMNKAVIHSDDLGLDHHGIHSDDSGWFSRTTKQHKKYKRSQ